MKLKDVSYYSILDLAVPLIAILAYVGANTAAIRQGSDSSDVSLVISLLILPILLITVITAVKKAEQVAGDVGEPYGTLVLTISITVIEVALLLSILAGEKGQPTLVRDTIFAVIMIVCNGFVGLCILVGGLKHREQDFEIKGANAYLAVISALSVLILILPNYTRSTAAPTLTQSQLVFVSIVTALLYAVFVYIQTVRHTEYFTEVDKGPLDIGFSLPDEKTSLFKATLILIFCLIAVVLLSKTFTDSIQVGLTRLGAPSAVVGFIVAGLILLPEGISAYRAAKANELQRSINLSLGSSLATIGLTVPVVSVLSIAMNQDLVLGLPGEWTVLLLLTLLISAFTFGTGRTNILYGFIHLIIFATVIFLIFIP